VPRALVAVPSHMPENNRLKPLTLAAVSHAEALCVFGIKRATRDFLRHSGFGDDEWVRESTAGELVLLLLDQLVSVERVGLDSWPRARCSR